MRKFIKIFLIALLLITLLTSCGKKVPVTDGKSAYEVAVENGFSGTVEEWLASLIGQNGKDGTGIEKVEIDYKGAIVITMTNGERYELWAEKFCTHDDMSKTITKTFNDKTIRGIYDTNVSSYFFSATNCFTRRSTSSIHAPQIVPAPVTSITSSKVVAPLSTASLIPPLVIL